MHAGLLNFIQELSLQESYQSVLDCSAVWLNRLVPSDAASLAFPVALSGSWALGAPKELRLTCLEEATALRSERRIPTANSQAGEAFLSGRMSGSQDHAEEEAVDLVALREKGILSSRSVPLIAGGQIIGTVNAARASASGFSADDDRALQEAATVIATHCLLHQRLAEAHQAAAEEVENSRVASLLQRLQLKLSHQPDEDAVCRTTAHYIKRIFRLDRAILALLDDSGDFVVIRALSGKKCLEEQDQQIPVKGSPYERSIVSNRAFAWNNASDGAEGLPSGVSVPLSSGRDVLGALILGSAEANALTAAHMAQITEVGRIVGTSLASLRAHCALRNAQTAAEAASASKGAFLANVSHELRTPLNGVLGMAQLLQGTELDAEQLELVGTITSSGQLLMRVISDVLEVSKIESGSTVLETIPFDLAAAVEKACAMVSPAAQVKGLEIDIQCSEGLPTTLLGDPTRLQQIVVNLLSNAVKFTAQGGIFVTVSTVDEEGDHTAIEIEVRDTGKGIAQDALERIFVPFQQEEASTTRRFGGTGLGLAICKEFATLMGGDIQAASVEGEGSTFTVRVVLGDAESEEETQCPEDEVLGALLSPELSEAFAESVPLQILVVDDNPVNRRVAQRLLQKLGYEPHLAPSGQAAIEATAAENFDLVLMDLSMPEVDGFEASEAIRSALEAPPTIVALTADVQETTRARCLEEGMLGVLAKPFTVPGLKKQLLEVHSCGAAS